MGRICMDCGELLHKEADECKHCGGKNISELNSSATIGDYITICKASTNPKFIKTMMELHDTDIIEYDLKLSQFAQQQPSQQDGITQVACPYCKSTNTNKITMTSKIINTALWGIFGTKRHKNYHCNNCNSDF